ncbi:MAG: hypothetical protein RIQ52_1714 [Pseudomonadota bacterium]
MPPGQILVINCGSSSIKYEWMAGGHDAAPALYAGQCECAPEDIAALFPSILEELAACPHLNTANLMAIGHRFVHGGHIHSRPLRLDHDSLAELETLTDLAPLHHAPALAGMRICLDLLPCIPQFAVFDTAFHHTLPPRAYRYALPESWYPEHHVRRYGFHGSSHAYAGRMAQTWLDLPADDSRIVTLHLGSGASACAIRNGCSIDTSMGFTPSEGLVMGTRSGDLDPGILPWMAGRTGNSVEALAHTLLHESGLKGLAGTADMRTLETRTAEGDADASLALDIWAYRIQKYVGAYFVALGGLDALVFTGGIGEHSAMARALVCRGLACLGIHLDGNANLVDTTHDVSDIAADDASIRVLVIKTREALEITHQIMACLSHD